MTSDRKLKAALEMKDLRDLNDLTIHDVNPISDLIRAIDPRSKDLLATAKQVATGVPRVHETARYRGTSLIRNSPLLQDRHRASDVVLL